MNNSDKGDFYFGISENKVKTWDKMSGYKEN